jgi:hypothetical protein
MAGKFRQMGGYIYSRGQKYTPLTFPFNVLSTENTIKDKITKIFHFITENTLLANTFPYYTCWNLLASKMAAVNFRCEAAASKTSKEWPFCLILYYVPAGQTPYVYMVRITIFGELLISCQIQRPIVGNLN